MHQAIYDRLAQVARAQGMITYSQVAPLAGLDMGNPAHRNELGRILGEISTYEHEQGRPMLSAVVIQQESGMPGQGFFTLAQELGIYGGGDDRGFFSRELSRVHAQWAQAEPASAGDRERKGVDVERNLLIPASVVDNLPAMVRNELAQLSAQKQEEFLEEYRRKAKSTGAAYAFWLIQLLFVGGLHYAYLRKWGLFVIFFLTFGAFLIWWLIDAFRIPGLVRDYNKDVAVDVMRALRTLSG